MYVRTYCMHECTIGKYGNTSISYTYLRTQVSQLTRPSLAKWHCTNSSRVYVAPSSMATMDRLFSKVKHFSLTSNRVGLRIWRRKNYLFRTLTKCTCESGNLYNFRLRCTHMYSSKNAIKSIVMQKRAERYEGTHTQTHTHKCTYTYIRTYICT